MEFDTNSIQITKSNDRLNLTPEQKLSNLSVFIYGMKGLGVMVSKNIILQGPRKITIYDNGLVTETDLKSNPHLDIDDVNKNCRADKSIQNLQNLNKNVNMNVYKGDLAHDFSILKEYDIVLLSEIISKDLVEALNIFCRENKIGFIYAACVGLSGFLFSDFGEEFLILDWAEEENSPNKTKNISNISNGNPGIVQLEDTEGLSHGDFVVFKEIVGMTELNDSPPRPIKVLSKNKITIEDTSKFTEYISDGILEKVKIPRPIFFKSLKESFENIYNEYEILTNINISNLFNPLRTKALHLIFLSLHEFFNVYNRLPIDDDTAKVIEISKRILALAKENERDWATDLISIDEELTLNIVKCSRIHFIGICSYLAGIVSQEIHKFTTQKFIPFNQWYIFDFFDFFNLNEENSSTLKLIEREALILDNNFSVLIVGENSELREILTLEGVKLGLEQLENVSEEKLKEYDLIYNTLSKEEDRLVLSRMCDWLQKPYITIGISGNKGFCQVSLSNTEYYNNLNSFIEGFKKNLVNGMHHLSKCCLSWAEKLYSNIFESEMDNLINLLNIEDKAEDDDEDQEEMIFNFLDNSVNHLPHIEAKEKLYGIKRLMEVLISNNFENCVEYSIFKFFQIFNYRVKLFILKYPSESLSEESKFWTNLKICPSPIYLDFNNKEHYAFIESFAYLISSVFKFDQGEGIKNINKYKIESIMSNPLFSLNNFQSLYSKQILNNKSLETENEKEIKALKEMIYLILQKNKNIHKIDPLLLSELNSNKFKNELIRCSSNIKRENYKIPQINLNDFFNQNQVENINIKSCINGFAALQLHSLKQFKNSNLYVDLGSSIVARAFCSIGVKKDSSDVIELETSLTVREIFELLGNLYNGVVKEIQHYTFHQLIVNQDNLDEVRDIKLEDYFNKVTKTDDNFLYLKATINKDNYKIKYKLN